MAVELSHLNGTGKQPGYKALPREGSPTDLEDRLAWTENQCRGWMQSARDSERLIVQLEQACAYLTAKVDRQSLQLDDQSARLREQQQSQHALQRCLDHLREQVSAVETSLSYRLSRWLCSHVLPQRSLRGRFVRWTLHSCRRILRPQR